MEKVNKETIMSRAIHDCMKEMYEKAQPMADWDNLIAEYKAGKIDKDERVFERHYLSHEEFKYILDKYVQAYRFENKWREYVNIVRDYLTKGGLKDKYIPDHIDENGDSHPAYRSAEQVPPIKNRIAQLLNNEFHLENADELSDKITDLVLDSVDNCKGFYHFEHDESSFNMAIALGASPTSNPNTVKKWWKENYNQDIEIEERNPNLFWDRDEYGDDFETVMIEEYGENWKEITDKKWKEEEARKKAEQEEKIAKMRAEMEKENGE